MVRKKLNGVFILLACSRQEFSSVVLLSLGFALIFMLSSLRIEVSINDDVNVVKSSGLLCS